MTLCSKYIHNISVRGLPITMEWHMLLSAVVYDSIKIIRGTMIAQLYYYRK